MRSYLEGEFFFNVFLFFSVKPGVCPHRRFDNIMCGEFCSNDSDCPNNEKCCFSGCGHQCMAPYTGEIWTKYQTLPKHFSSGLRNCVTKPILDFGVSVKTGTLSEASTCVPSTTIVMVRVQDIRRAAGQPVITCSELCCQSIKKHH